MQGVCRKIFQAASYEVIAILFIAPVFACFYDEGLGSSAALSVIISTVAVFWNVAYNYIFECWEARQNERERTFFRRALHSVGFEGGLTLILLPVISYWLHITLFEALLANLALFAFFFVYSFVFQFVFDRIFDVPDSAKPVDTIGSPS